MVFFPHLRLNVYRKEAWTFSPPFVPVEQYLHNKEEDEKMKRMISICVALAMLLFAIAQAEDAAFEAVCEQLAQAGWLTEDYAVAQDELGGNPRAYVQAGDVYAEMIVTGDGALLQYAFQGALQTAEDLTACIAATGAEDAQAIAEAVLASYAESSAYQAANGAEAGRVPTGRAVRGSLLYELQSGWLTILNTDALMAN